MFSTNLGSGWKGTPNGIWLGFRDMGITGDCEEMRLIMDLLRLDSEIFVTRLE